MASYSNNSGVSTYVSYKGLNYQGFGFTDRSTISINSIRTQIAVELEIPALSSHDIVEIENDDNNYVVLNDRYLANKHPWKSYSNAQRSLSSTKRVNLRIVSNTESESNISPVIISPTQSVHQNENTDNAAAVTTSNDVGYIHSDEIITIPSATNDNSRFLPDCAKPPDINDLRFNAQFLSEPLKFIDNVAPQQRLQYPREKNLVLIQTKKAPEDRRKCMQPILQIPTDHVNFIDAGGSVELISAVVNQVYNHDQSSYFCLAPHRGFWSPDPNNRLSEDTPFLNPFIWPISREHLQKVETAVGEPSFQVKLPLRLMYAVGTKYDTISSPLVRFDHTFVLANAPPVPSHYDYSPYRAPTTTNEQETCNKKQCYIWCALRSDPQCDCQDFNTDCLSDMFTVEPRTNIVNNPGPRKRLLS